MRLKRQIIVGILGLVLFSGMLSALGGRAFAAGSVQYTSESNSSATSGGTLTVSIYVTPSGASMWDGEVIVNLTNLTLASYASGSSPFGIAQVTSGNSPGATTLSIGVAHTGGSGTAAGSKALMGTLTLNVGNAASGQIQLVGNTTEDFDLNPMSPTSGQSRSISIACPSGQTGTPPSCTTPSGGGGGGGSGGSGGSGSGNGGSGGSGGSGSTANPNTSNPVDNPNPDSTTNVGTDANGQPIEATENDLSLASSNIDATATEQVATVTKSSVLKRSVLIGTIAAVVLLVLVGAKLIVGKMAHSRSLAGPSSGPSFTSTEPTDSEEAAPTDDDDHNLPPTPGGAGPTIIHPQQ